MLRDIAIAVITATLVAGLLLSGDRGQAPGPLQPAPSTMIVLPAYPAPSPYPH